MGIPIEELTRAGLVEVAGAKLEKSNGPTHIRSAAAQSRGQTDIRADDPRTPSKLERDSRDGALAKVSVQKGSLRQFLVRVTAIRKRLLDEDNLCEKYHVDLCRYAGVLSGDSPATTRIEVCQQKAEPGAAEETRIEVFEV